MNATIPPALMRPRSIEWNLLAGQIVGGGPARPAGTPSGGLWFATVNDVPLLTFARLKAFRQLRMLANGGTTPIVVPRLDNLQPWPLVAGLPVKAIVSKENVEFFDDGAGYGIPIIVAETVSAAVFGATRLTLDISIGAALRGGECFSIRHATRDWRLYEIATVTVDGAGHACVSFAPRLREDTPAATAVDFNMPRCLMRALHPAALDHKFEAPWFATQSMTFIEYPIDVAAIAPSAGEGGGYFGGHYYGLRYFGDRFF